MAIKEEIQKMVDEWSLVDELSGKIKTAFIEANNEITTLSSVICQLSHARDTYRERMIRKHEEIERLKAEIAALTQALDEATKCAKCGSTGIFKDPVHKNCHGHECNKCYPSRSHRIYPETLTPASRALCERLFGGAK